MSKHRFGYTTRLGALPDVHKDAARPILEQLGVSLEEDFDSQHLNAYWFECPDGGEDANRRKKGEVQAALQERGLWPLHNPKKHQEFEPVR